MVLITAAGEADEDIFFEVEEEIDDETGETVEVYEVKEVGRVKIDPSGAIDTIAEPVKEDQIVAGLSKKAGEGGVSSGNDNEASVNSLRGEASTSGAGEAVARSHREALTASSEREAEALPSERTVSISENVSASSSVPAVSDERFSDAEAETSESGSFSEDGSDGESDGEWSGQDPFRVFGKTFGRKRRLGALSETAAEPVRASEVIGSLNDEWRRAPAAKAPANVSTAPGPSADAGATSGPSTDVSTTSGAVGGVEGSRERGPSDGIGLGIEDGLARRVGVLVEDLAGRLKRLDAADAVRDDSAFSSGSISKASLRTEAEAEELSVEDSFETSFEREPQETSGSVWLDEHLGSERPSSSASVSENGSASNDDVSGREGPSAFGGEETQLTGPPKKSKKELRKEAAQVPHLGSGRSNYERDLAMEFFSKKSFTTAGASEDAAVALAAMGVLRPSHIQVCTEKAV